MLLMMVLLMMMMALTIPGSIHLPTLPIQAQLWPTLANWYTLYLGSIYSLLLFGEFSQLIHIVSGIRNFFAFPANSWIFIFQINAHWILDPYPIRVDIWRDRCDRRSRKNLVRCVIFLENNGNNKTLFFTKNQGYDSCSKHNWCKQWIHVVIFYAIFSCPINGLEFM